MSIRIGIDPGKSGCISVITDYSATFPEHVAKPYFFTLKNATEADVWQWLKSATIDATGDDVRAVIEKVSSSPQMGVTSAFTFGRSFGFLLGILAAREVPYAFVTPQKWQKAMGCMSKGDKNVTKAAAQRLYPQEKITHANADALLLATYCRRHASELF
jgi:crossover junction endodeoxyribonuclease RuvC